MAQLSTVTLNGTIEGKISGTPAYMSPEQATGQRIDKRSDIWAFGCVLYEMVTGKKAFSGNTVSDILAAVREREPDWQALEKNAPPSITKLTQRCLEKDAKRRLRDIGDARSDLEEVSDTAGAPPPRSSTASARVRYRWLAAAMLLGLGTAIASLVVFSLRRPPALTGMSRLTVAAPPGVEIREGSAISPDGRKVVFAGRAAGVDKLWLRPLDSLDSRELPGTETAAYAFWSPDGRFIAFFATGKLKRIDVQTGVVSVVCDVGLGRGGTWNERGVIVFNSVNDGPLLSVAASGGTPTPLTALDTSQQEDSHRWPYFLPGGRRFLYYIRSANPDVQGVYLGSLDDAHEKIRIVNSALASNAVFIVAGPARPSSIAWAQNGNLMTQPLDLDRARLTGEPVALAQNVHSNAPGRNAEISVSADGLLLYATQSAVQYRLTWFDRGSKPQATFGQPEVYETARISPDGNRVAVWRQPLSGPAGIAVLDVSTASPRRYGVGFGAHGRPTAKGSRLEGGHHRVLRISTHSPFTAIASPRA